MTEKKADSFLRQAQDRRQALHFVQGKLGMTNHAGSPIKNVGDKRRE